MASITFILPGYAANAGGGYKVVYEYANYLVGRGHAVSVLQMRPNRLHDSDSPFWKAGLRALRYRLFRHVRPRWFALDRRVSLTNYSRQFIKAIPKSDVIIATAMETVHFVALASNEKGIPGFYFIQGYEDWLQETAAVDVTWRLPLQRLVISSWLKEKAAELGVEAVKIANAIDQEAFPAGAPISDRPMQVLALVSDDALKRTDVIAKAFSYIAAEVPGASLKTFGVIKRPSILPTDVAHVQNPTPAQLRMLYQESRVYVCASDAEGFGLPPAEAMSSGAAVASTDVSGVRGYADGIALFSPIGNAEKLAENVVRLLRDEALCGAIAVAGIHRLSSYTPAHAGAAFEQEILKAIGRV